MSAAGVLGDLRRRGIVVTVADGQVVVQGPREAITAELRETIRRNRSEILSLAVGRVCLPSLTGAAPKPPHQSASGDDDEVLALVVREFAKHGTQPAPDDLDNAVTQELCIATWREWLDAVYRGEMTLVRGSDGQLFAFRRGAPC